MATVSATWRRLRDRLRQPGGEPTDPRVALLLGSGLFDHRWYSLCSDRPMGRREAVEHYLASGRDAGLTPHPLFLPEYCAQMMDLEDPGDEDPLVVYLRDRRFDAAVHPLFDLDAYLAAFPDAVAHRDGPLGHYGETGAAAGARVNDWYGPDPSSEPRGLVDWLWSDATAWVERQRLALPAWGGPAAAEITSAEARPPVDDRIGLTTVVLVAERPAADLTAAIRSVVGQTCDDWELWVLGVGHVPQDVPGADPRIRVHPEPQPSLWAARNRGLELAAGTHVAWMSSAATWLPGRLSSLRHALADDPDGWAHDCLREDRAVRPPRRSVRRGSRARLRAGFAPELDTVVVAGPLARRVHGFDESLRGGHVLDFLLRIGEHAEPCFAPRLGVVLDGPTRRGLARLEPNDRPWVDFERLPTSNDVVLNEHLVDWADLERRDVEPGLVSVLVPTYQDWEMTTLAVRRVVEHRTADLPVEVIVIDNGCGLAASGILGALSRTYDDVRLVRSPVNHGFSLGNNLGLAEARGGTVVFLNNDTEVQPGWLEPLVDALRDDQVLGAQSLLVYPDGTVQSAGVVFPRGGGLPHVLLQGFPVEDTRGLEGEPLHALTGAALALRFRDAVALRGFDPIFRNGMEDVDICLRLESSRPGHFVVLPDSVVIHHESRTPGRFTRSVMNRRVLLERWAGRLPEDDVIAWRRRGYAVVGHEIRSHADRDRRLCVAEPVVVRIRNDVQVVEGFPVLRWALKHAAPTGPEGEKWGDTHFARHLAHALRELGQEVVIDHREAVERSSGNLDDVALVLRGLTRYTPLLDRVNLMWLISHPDLVERTEHIGYDRVYVASVPFAHTMAEEWGAPAVPLLQATDPALFHPDLAEPDTGDRVLFIGNSRQETRPLVVAAAERGLDLSIYGSGWSGLVDDRFVRGTYLANDRVGAAYRAAGVVLNDHWADMRDQGFLSNRLFDAVAAGARVVTDAAAGVEEVFGDAVRVVHDPAELASLVEVPDLDAVFGDDQTRRAHAARIAAEHSFAARARTLLEDALAIRAARGFR